MAKRLSAALLVLLSGLALAQYVTSRYGTDMVRFGFLRAVTLEATNLTVRAGQRFEQLGGPDAWREMCATLLVDYPSATSVVLYDASGGVLATYEASALH